MTITNHAASTPESTGGLTPGTWTVEPMHSEVGFSVRHLGLSKVRGRFNTFSGSVVVGADAAASSVSAVVDLASVDTNNEQRDDRLLQRRDPSADAVPVHLGLRGLDGR